MKMAHCLLKIGRKNEVIPFKSHILALGSDPPSRKGRGREEEEAQMGRDVVFACSMFTTTAAFSRCQHARRPVA